MQKTRAHTFNPRLIYVLLISGLLFLMTACGDDDGPAETDADDSAAATTDPDGEGVATEDGFVVPADVPCDEIIVYSSFPDEQVRDMSRGFEELTDIRVRNIVMSSGEAMGRLRAEAANPQADYWLSVRGATLQAAHDDYDPPTVLAYSPATIDNAIERFQYADYPVFTGIGMYPLVFFYNPEIVEREGLDVPQTYDDLLDPQYEGKLIMPHPSTSGTAFTLLTVALELYGDEGGWDYIQQLSQNVDQFTRSGRAPQNLVAQGEYPIGIGFFDAVYYLGVDGFPIESVFPEPIFGEPFSGQVVQGGPNEECGELYHDWLLTEEPQRALLEYGTYSVRGDIPPPEGAAPLADLDLMDYDWPRWAVEREDVLDEFDRLIGVSPTEE